MRASDRTLERYVLPLRSEGLDPDQFRTFRSAGHAALRHEPPQAPDQRKEAVVEPRQSIQRCPPIQLRWGGNCLVRKHFSLKYYVAMLRNDAILQAGHRMPKQRPCSLRPRNWRHWLGLSNCRKLRDSFPLSDRSSGARRGSSGNRTGYARLRAEKLSLGSCQKQALGHTHSQCGRHISRRTAMSAKIVVAATSSPSRGQFPSESAAIAQARSAVANGAIGAIMFRRSGDPALGEYGEAVRTLWPPEPRR